MEIKTLRTEDNQAGVADLFSHHHKILSNVTSLNFNSINWITAEIHLTDRCNAKCPWCSRVIKSEEVDLSSWILILWGLKRLGVKGIVFSGGGEPTLYPNLGSVVQEAYELGFKVGLYTNGYMLPQGIDDWGKKLTFVRISLDGYGSVWSKLKGLDWDVFVNNLNHYASLKPHTTVGVSYLTHKDNISVIFDAYRLAIEELDLDYFQVKPPLPDVGTVEDPFLRSLKLVNILQKISELRKSHVSWGTYYKIWARSTRPEDHFGVCFAPYFVVTLSPNGSMYPCCHLRRSRYTILGSDWWKARLNTKDVTDGVRKVVKLVSEDSFKHCRPLCKYMKLSSMIWNAVHPTGHSYLL